MKWMKMESLGRAGSICFTFHNFRIPPAIVETHRRVFEPDPDPGLKCKSFQRTADPLHPDEYSLTILEPCQNRGHLPYLRPLRRGAASHPNLIRSGTCVACFEMDTGDTSPAGEPGATGRKRVSTACEACRATKIKCQPSEQPGVCRK
jgi:hypothetical protein